MEASLKSHKLFLYTNTKSPLDIQTHILFLVLIGDLDLLTVGLEIMVRDATEPVMVHGERLVKYTVDVIVTAVGRREGETE